MKRHTSNLVRRSILCCALFAAGLALLVDNALAAAPRVLPEGKLPDDRRLGELQHYNGYFPFDPPKTAKEWKTRSEAVRRRVLVAAGMWPMPTKTPLNAVIHGRIERDDYTVDKVYFESYPGHFVTGLLYRPKGKSGPLPGVLCPHGHGGRLQDHGEQGVRKQIVQGAERFELAGRFPKRSRCVTLARMGCVAFIYDMLGYADSQQIPSSVAHRFGKQRPELNSPERWGFYSAQAEMRMQSILGVQMHNSVRALDFLCSLPDVDPQRIGVTGGSGGGTQTILLGAIDPRPDVAFPQGMVSTAMQGGCTCENACLLRIGTGNIELAGMFAPKPLAMTGANDWTKDIMTKGLPELKALYSVLGVEANVMAKPLLHFRHNYNYVTRAIMYSWMNKHLHLGLEEPIVEEDYQPLLGDELTVWDDEHPQPPGGLEHELALLRWMDEDARHQLAALVPKDAASLKKYRDVVGGAVDTLIGRGLPKPGAVQTKVIASDTQGAFTLSKLLVRNEPAGEQLPAVLLTPNEQQAKTIVVWIHEQGKSGLFGDDGAPRGEIGTLLESGVAVLSADLIAQGEFLADGKPPTQQRKVQNPRQAACFTQGYNHSLFAQRVHDVLTLVAAARDHKPSYARVHLAGLGGAGRWVAAARAQAGDAVDRAVIDTDGFRFANVQSIRDLDFLPGAIKYGDLPGLISLSAPHELLLAGEGKQLPEIVVAAYAAAGAGKNLVKFTRPSSGTAAAAAQWLGQPR